jgi:hypothetical protein
MRNLVLSLALIAAIPIVAVRAEEGHQVQGDHAGTCRGLVIAVEPAGSFTMRSPKGEFTYIPRWSGGAPDPEILAKIRQLQPGDYVEVGWEQDEHLRVVRLSMIGHQGERREERREERRDGGHEAGREGGHEERREERGVNEAAAFLDGPGPAERSGVVRGTVISVDPKGRFVVKTPAGAEEPFVPNWTGGMPAEGGAFDKEMVARIAQLKPGQQVEVSWEWGERKRCVGVKQVGN